MVSAVKKLTVEKICGEKSYHGQRYAVKTALSAVAKINHRTAHISAVKSLNEDHYCDIS